MFKAGVRRAFVDSAAGQIHIRTFSVHRPGGKTPLLCLHQSPNWSGVYEPALPFLGSDRFVVAADTPGFGESFRPAQKPAIADYATWLSEVPAALDLEQVDLIGYFTGCAIASDMAVRYPGLIRRVVLIGPPVFTPEQQEKFLRDAWPARPRADGSHIMAEWNRVMRAFPPDMPLDLKAETVTDFFRGGPNAIWGEEAVSVYDLAGTLPQLKQPVLIAEPDGILGNARKAHALVPHSLYQRWDGVPGRGTWQAAPAWIAGRIHEFLDDPDAG